MPIHPYGNEKQKSIRGRREVSAGKVSIILRLTLLPTEETAEKRSNTEGWVSAPHVKCTLFSVTFAKQLENNRLVSHQH